MKLLELVQNENSQVGVQMRITLDWLQQTAGVSFSKLEKPEKRTPHLEDTWLKTLTDFLHDSNCAITIPGTYKVQLRRKEDANLMERVAIMANYADGAMKQINWCRLYMRVETLADIGTAEGKHISTTIYAYPPRPSQGQLYNGQDNHARKRNSLAVACFL